LTLLAVEASVQTLFYPDISETPREHFDAIYPRGNPGSRRGSRSSRQCAGPGIGQSHAGKDVSGVNAYRLVLGDPRRRRLGQAHALFFACVVDGDGRADHRLSAPVPKLCQRPVFQPGWFLGAMPAVLRPARGGDAEMRMNNLAADARRNGNEVVFTSWWP